MPESEVDLVSLFSAVTRALDENRIHLNEADAYNHNHGDNMVKNLKVITKALKQKQGASPSEQLAYASEILGQKSTSGSAQLYSQGLTRAANQLEGQRAVTAQNAISLVQALMGGQQTSAQTSQSTSGDMMSGLMGALLGGGLSAPQTAQPEENLSSDMLGGLMGALLGGDVSGSQTAQPAENQSSDMLGGLMGALLGGGTTATQSQAASSGQASDGIDLNTLLTAGMAFMQAQQQGASTIEALVQAVMAGSQMNTSAHHSQSGQLVAGTLLNALSTMLGGKKQ